MSAFRTYTHPDGQQRSAHWMVRVNGVALDVLQAGGADFAPFEISGPVDIEIEGNGPLADAAVRPLSRGISARSEGRMLSFRLERADNLCVEASGRPTLFLYANAPETNRPDSADPSMVFFAAGVIDEVGTWHVQPGTTLYVEGGAVVRGLVRALRADGIRICGRGIIDGGEGRCESVFRPRLCVLEGCRNVTVEDVILIDPHAWTLVFGACEDVLVRNVKAIGSVMCSDGIDVCGSRRVRIEGCCLRSNDDCVAVKALDYSFRENDAAIPWVGDVEDICVRDCTLWNAAAGNAMEIGFELRCERVSGVVFENIDVLCVHGHGAVFSIHVGDRALVENVVWRNIRIEHHYDKLLDFRVIRSRYSRDRARGCIRGVVLENIQVARSVFNEGETKSLITGWSAESPAEDVTLRNVCHNGERVTNADQLDLFVRHARNVRFE